MKYTAEECEALEGKEIKWGGRNGWKETTAIVAGCDPDIGISIVREDNTEEELSCLPGPVSEEHHFFENNYVPLFELMVGMIKKGHYRPTETAKIRPTLGTGNMSPCPFK